MKERWWEQYKVTVPEGVSGKWRVERFTIPEVPNIESLRCALAGRAVHPGTYTRLTCQGYWDPVMTDTPAEIRDHMGIISRAKGRVLINGLGLGVALKGVLARPEVTHVDVVEREQDVIDLVWPTYAADPRVELHHADAYIIRWPKGTCWDYIWHDIWPSICLDNLPEIARLKRKYSRKFNCWQRAWVETELRYQKRHGRPSRDGGTTTVLRGMER